MTLDTDLRCLQRLPMLKEIDPAKLKLIALVAERVEFAPGDVLYRQGDPSDAVFVTFGGRLSVVAEGAETESVIWSLQNAVMLGQVGILSGHPRVVTIRAEEQVSALKLSSDDFNMLIHDVPPFAVAVMRELALQLEASSRGHVERFRYRERTA
jgi:CRP-like cAMP-binding protein